MNEIMGNENGVSKGLGGVKFYYQRISFLTELLDLQLRLRQEFLLELKFKKRWNMCLFYR